MIREQQQQQQQQQQQREETVKDFLIWFEMLVILLPKTIDQQ